MTREDILVQVLLEEPDGTSSIAVADEVDRAARIPPWHEPFVRSPKPCVAKLLGVILAIVDAAQPENLLSQDHAEHDQQQIDIRDGAGASLFGNDPTQHTNYDKRAS